MDDAIDVVFVTHVERSRDFGDPATYRPLRMEIDGRVASLPVLRSVVKGAGAGQAGKGSRQAPPLLTPIFVGDYLARRKISCLEIPCFDAGEAALYEAVDRGVGVFALSTTWVAHPGGAEQVRRAAAKLKTLAPGVPIVVGGVGARKGLLARQKAEKGELAGVDEAKLAGDYVLMDAHRDADFDAIIISESGEEVLAAIARCIRDGEDWREIPNIAIPDGDDYRFTDIVSSPCDVENEIVDWRNYRQRIVGFEAPIRTGVGCPFPCQFCDFASLYKCKVRTPDSIVRELRTLAECTPEPRHVFFVDDNIGLTPRKLKDLTRALTKARLGLRWRAFMRADCITAETAELLRESGCCACLLGVESGSPRILNNMKKRLSPERTLEAIRHLDDNGIRTQSTFVVGFPGEDDSTINETVQLISAYPSGDSANSIHRYYLFPFQVMPLMPVAGKEGREKWQLTGVDEEWAHCTMDSNRAREAMREVFMNVRGPSHMYFEFIPPEWSVECCRRVLELRDDVQRENVRGTGDPSLADLFKAVEEAELE